MQFDFTQLLGLAGAPVVESAVQYLKVDWLLAPKMAPIASVFISILWNILIGSLLLGGDLRTSIMMGLLTAFAANGWHEIQKMNA